MEQVPDPIVPSGGLLRAIEFSRECISLREAGKLDAAVALARDIEAMLDGEGRGGECSDRVAAAQAHLEAGTVFLAKAQQYELPELPESLREQYPSKVVEEMRESAEREVQAHCEGLLDEAKKALQESQWCAIGREALLDSRFSSYESYEQMDEEIQALIEDVIQSTEIKAGAWVGNLACLSERERRGINHYTTASAEAGGGLFHSEPEILDKIKWLKQDLGHGAGSEEHMWRLAEAEATIRITAGVALIQDGKYKGAIGMIDPEPWEGHSYENDDLTEETQATIKQELLVAHKGIRDADQEKLGDTDATIQALLGTN